MTEGDCYQALLDRNAEYDGIFYVGVTTTGVFCRPTCPARKPKFENCEFFDNAEQALLAAYRPCKRCQPLSHPQHVPELVRRLVKAVEQDPERRWSGRDLATLSIDASTARRQFKRRFGMTFAAYARARRMGIAMRQIREGGSVINAQLSAGYGSGSGFRDAFSRIMGAAPGRVANIEPLKAAWLDTRLGPMLAVADDSSLFLLQFLDRRGLERQVERLRKKVRLPIIPGDSPTIRLVSKELARYFDGRLQEFSVSLRFAGSPFQEKVWAELRSIPYGSRRSYSGLAASIGSRRARRAIAQANSANPFTIIVPCHRVVAANGLGGYGGGVGRKQWLLEHELGNLKRSTKGKSDE